MALLLIEGFEGYASAINTTISTYMARRGWVSTNSGGSQVGLMPGRIAGYALTDYYNAGSYNSTWTYSNLPTTANTLILGVAFYQNTAAITSTFNLYDGATLGVNVSVVASTGVITVKTGATTLTTYTAATLINTWYYLEIKVLCDSSVGTVEVRLNGVSIISLTGQNTKAGTHSYHNGFSINASAQFSTQRFDDIYVCDNSGSTQNNFLGVCQVIGLLPTADAVAGQWTTSTGSTHYNLVNERLEDDDTTYVYSSTTAQQDYYTFTQLLGTGPILGLQINTTCRISSGTSAILETPVSSNSVVAIGADTTVSSTTYTDVCTINLLDPNTNAAWTVAGLNAAMFGLKIM